ncbi:MAG TPA: endonuclease/exonuclease/phosphatase family protein [Solirubrobacteraceae bacterium]|jgi:endonuclease/exonuclease/phosphatase family metal-dependent hydrolase|nr:endonuclease/exonuclease/phosphatase family protein [Solirubrobacteraceae bacterium]
MPSVRLASFNVENLFARWRFRGDVDPAQANKKGWIVDESLFMELGDEDKAITAAAIEDVRADVLALQEVEGLDTLKHFRDQFLGLAEYPHVAGIDGNDPRLIDVAVMSRFPIVHVRSYQHLPDPDLPVERVFSRDCLEVDVDAGGAVVTLFVNHFKSMAGGRAATRRRRVNQVAAVMQIVRARFGDAGDAPFAVLGDLNDFPQRDQQGETALGDLLAWEAVENVVDRLPEDERWTHYWDDKEEYRQLDYVLLSRHLAERLDGPPQIYRQGMPLRAVRYRGDRLRGVGWDRPKASDHCAVAVDLEL